MLWTIGIPTVPCTGRRRKLARLLSMLRPQVERHPDVEIRILETPFWEAETPIGTHSIGGKLNTIIAESQAKYVSIIGDDDLVSDSYVSRIVEALRRNAPTLITFNVSVNMPGKPPMLTKFSPHFTDANRPDFYERRPNQSSVWCRSLCLPFPEISFGEDTEWSWRMQQATRELFEKNPHAWINIDEPLYTYLFDPRDSVQLGTVGTTFCDDSDACIRHEACSS